MSSVLDRLFANFDEAEARRELEAARREVQAIQDTLVAYDQWRNREHPMTTAVKVLDEAASGKTEATAKASGNGRRGQTSRAVIRKLFREHDPETEWTTPEVRKALGVGPDRDHAIQTSLSRLERNGELKRPRIGVYKLPPKERNPEGEKRETGTLEETTP